MQAGRCCRLAEYWRPRCGFIGLHQLVRAISCFANGSWRAQSRNCARAQEIPRASGQLLPNIRSLQSDPDAAAAAAAAEDTSLLSRRRRQRFLRKRRKGPQLNLIDSLSAIYYARAPTHTLCMLPVEQIRSLQLEPTCIGVAAASSPAAAAVAQEALDSRQVRASGHIYHREARGARPATAGQR